MKHALASSTLAFLLVGCAVQHSGELPQMSEAAQQRRFAAFQQALEFAPGDRPVRWQLGQQLRGSVTPIDTVESKVDGWCRSYEELIAEGLQRYRLVGIACRKPPGQWLVLDLRSFGGQG